MNKKCSSVALIGGGIAGWYSAKELASRGYHCVLIDQNPPGGHASTNNQNWLQSGALYVAGEIPDFPTAEACQQGYQEMRSCYKEVTRPEIPAYFLTTHQEQLAEIVQCCKQCNIQATPVRFEDIIRSEPLLKDGQQRHILKVPDCPFNNAQLLQAIADQACEKGVVFQAATHLESIVTEWDGTYWHLFLDNNREIICKFIILTCGVYIPTILEKILPGQAQGFICVKNPVLVLRSDRAIANSMLLTVYEPDGLHLTPFVGAGISGVTVCFVGFEEAITDYCDHMPPSHWEEEFAKRLQDFLPGIMSLASQNTILAHVYVCQKLRRSEGSTQSRQPFCLSYAPEENAPRNVLVAYPGKMTSASLLAKMCASKVEEQLLADYPHASARGGTIAPTIARPRYCDDATHQLIVEDQHLAFRPLRHN